MKKIQRFNLMAFPYSLLGIAIFVLFNQLIWLSLAIMIVAFFAWSLSAYYNERSRLMKYLESRNIKKVSPPVEMNQAIIDDIISESKSLDPEFDIQNDCDFDQTGEFCDHYDMPFHPLSQCLKCNKQR